MADLTAKADWKKIRITIPDYGFASLEYKDIIKDITPTGEWILCEIKTVTPTPFELNPDPDITPTSFVNITKDRHRYHQLDYLENRDNNRAQKPRNLPQKWQGASYNLAGIICIK